MAIKSRSDNNKKLIPLALKTWLYFAIMAAFTMLLLWLFQFIFFDVLYNDRQEAHLKSIGNELFSQDYGLHSAPHFETLEMAAKRQNISIYLFTFDPADVRTVNGESSFPSDCDIKIYTPDYQAPSATLGDLRWTKERTVKYLTELLNMDESGQFIYIEDIGSEVADNFIMGGALKGDMGSKKAYYCLTATISRANYTVTIVQNMIFFAMAIILIISVPLSYVLARRIALPINRLAVTAKQMAKNDFNVQFNGDSFDEVRQLAQSLNFAKEELSKTEQMRRDFIANISHDLRTPLTMIKAYAEMIRDLSGNNPEKRAAHCGIIIEETDRLSLLVQDIQNLSKLQSGTETFKSENFDLSLLCKTVVGRFSIMSEKHGFEFITDCDDVAMTTGDSGKIEQVLYNLIGNAVNYTGEDKKVTVRCKKADEGFKVEVIDTGKGIAPDEIDYVWERFYRANEKKRNVIGSGLGLNIVKMILEGHKAKYGVNSEQGKGTTFWFVLPFA